MQKSVIDQLKRKQIAALLEQDKRIDGRGLEEQRKLVLETGVIPKANGSARVLLGRIRQWMSKHTRSCWCKNPTR